MLLAVPLIMLIAVSTDAAFKSGIFVSAISFNWAFVTLATFLEFGSPYSLSIFAAFFKRTAAGGVFKIKSNDYPDIQ